MRALVDAVRRAGQARAAVRARPARPRGGWPRATGHEATTIHRLLEWSGEEGGFTRDEADPIPGADLLVVDEASMLSLRLADALFRAVGPRTHVLLVGDADQLPPVGAGRVLDDLLDSDAVPAVRLTEIFRQARRSLIVRAAHAINHGERPPTQPDDDDGLRDFFLVCARRAGGAVRRGGLAGRRRACPAHYDLDPVARRPGALPHAPRPGRHRGAQHRAARAAEPRRRADLAARRCASATASSRRSTTTSAS